MEHKVHSQGSSDFKKFFSGTMGIVTAILVLLAGVCLCCMIFYAIGLSQEGQPTSFIQLRPQILNERL